MRRTAALLICALLVLAAAACSSEPRQLPESVVDTFIQRLRDDDDSRTELVWPESVSPLEASQAVQLLGDPLVDVFPAAYSSDSPTRPVAEDFDGLASVTVVRGPTPSEITSAPAVQYEFGLGDKDGRWWILCVTEMPAS